MQDLAAMLIKIINPSATIAMDNERLRPEKSEVERLLGSNEKIFQLTGWTPSFTLEQGLKLTIEWFSDKTNLGLYKADIFNL
jgi:nucleoside-diphosphate-sugar epimerase